MTSEPIETKNTIVKCNGGSGVLGHPVIFLNLGAEEKVVCPYCSKCFVRAYSAKAETKTKGLRRAS
jgi:uncharacterized Zn-finger protein